MGCVSSALLEGDGAGDDRRRIISLSHHHHHHHHVVSLTSSTYGILTSPRAYCTSSTSEDSAATPPTQQQKSPPPPPPPPMVARASATPPPPKPESNPHPQPAPTAEVINSWELMAGLVDPSTPAKQHNNRVDGRDNRRRRIRFPLRPIGTNSRPGPPSSAPLVEVVLYTTSLRGVRSTFEACNAVRAALQAHGVAFRERDVSMDRGFREELRELTRGSGLACLLPRLFVRGRHVGGAEEVLRMEEEGLLGPMLEGLPRGLGGGGGGGGGGDCCCDGCGGMRFLPCFDCSGSRKVVLTLPPPLQMQMQPASAKGGRPGMVVARCGECNENGLVLCPICS